MDKTLSLEGPYSLGEASFDAISERLAVLNPRIIVEFGSGASTARWALRFPQARVSAVDHEREFANRARELCVQVGVASRTDVQVCPLRWYVTRSGVYQSYSAPSLPEVIDAVVIDGPPSFTRRGREHCLYLLSSRIRVGGLVFLDDFGRSPEKRIARNWRLVFPECFREVELSVGHGVLVLEVVRRLPAPRRSALVALDSTLANGRRVVGAARRFLSSHRTSW